MQNHNSEILSTTEKDELVTTSRQMILNFPVLQSHSTEDFVIGPSNRLAVDLIKAWPAWTSHALMLIGEEGCGKTHLARIWAERAQARTIIAQDLLKSSIPSLGRVVVVEGADNASDQEALLHLFNWVHGERGYIILTARAAPGHWRSGLADLVSRLKSTPVAHLDAPDEILLSALLVKQFSDRQIVVESSVIAFLAARIERSFAAVKQTVSDIDQLSLRKQSPITIPLAREVLQR